jgi:hypothetical protein
MSTFRELRGDRRLRFGRSKSPPGPESPTKSSVKSTTGGGFGAPSLNKQPNVIDLTGAPDPVDKVSKPSYFGASPGNIFRASSTASSGFSFASEHDYRTVMGPYGPERLAPMFTPAHPYAPPAEYSPLYSSSSYSQTFNTPSGYAHSSGHSSGASFTPALPLYPSQHVPPPPYSPAPTSTPLSRSDFVPKTAHDYAPTSKRK